jgi:hypothetical protein
MTGGCHPLVPAESRRFAMVKPILASISALAATVLLSAGALAGGATVMHFNLNSPQQCFDKGPYTICSVATGEETAVQTPSGNFSGEVNTTSSFVFSYNGTVIESGADAFHEHVLYTNNFTVLKEGGMHETSTFTYAGTTCTYTLDLHVTDLNPYTGTGHIQYDNFSYVCV